MKKLFSVLMVAVVATLAFAFTPKASLLDVTYHLDGTEWVEGEGENCTGNAAACQISFDVNYVDFLNQIIDEIPATGSSFIVDVDHDSNPNTPTVPVTVSVLRFP